MNETVKEKKLELNDSFFEELSGKFADYMTKSLDEKISKIDENIKELSNGKKENKEAIVTKYTELKGILIKLKEKIKLQNQLQNEVLKLTEKKVEIDEEINKLLLC